MEIFIREEVEHQERKQRGTGHQRGGCCKLYDPKVLYFRRHSCNLQEESAVTAPPSSQMLAEEQSGSGGRSKDQLSSCGMTWMKRGGRNANVPCRHEKIGFYGAERDQRRGTAHQEGLNTWGKRSSVEKLNEARKSKRSLKQKKGWRTKHATAKLT